MRGYGEKSEMEMKLKVVQLCIDVSTWSMMAILGLRRIQVKREIVRIMTGIRCEGRQNFKDHRTNVHKKPCSVSIDLDLVYSTNDKI